MNNLPLISIIIPTYNRRKIISATIESALLQSYPNLEIIVLDNGSDDGSYEYLVNKYIEYKSVKIYKNENILPIVSNWQKSISYANGIYAHILWSDDLIHKNFISKCYDLISKNEDCAFVYSRTKIFSNSIEYGKEVFHIGNSGYYNKDVFIERSLLDPPLSVPVSPANALFRTNDLKDCLLLNIPNKIEIDFKNIGQGNDNLIFLLALNNYKSFGYINETLSFFRYHKESITISTNSNLVTIRYHQAKAFYVENYLKDNKKLERNFNSKIYLLLIYYKIITGIAIKTNDLYQSNRKVFFSKTYMLITLLKYLLYKVKNAIINNG